MIFSNVIWNLEWKNQHTGTPMRRRARKMMNQFTSLPIRIATGFAFTIFPSRMHGSWASPTVTSQAEQRNTARCSCSKVTLRGAREISRRYCRQKSLCPLYMALNSTRSGRVTRLSWPYTAGSLNVNVGRMKEPEGFRLSWTEWLAKGVVFLDREGIGGRTESFPMMFSPTEIPGKFYTLSLCS